MTGHRQRCHACLQNEGRSIWVRKLSVKLVRLAVVVDRYIAKLQEVWQPAGTFQIWREQDVKLGSWRLDRMISDDIVEKGPIVPLNFADVQRAEEHTTKVLPPYICTVDAGSDVECSRIETRDLRQFAKVNRGRVNNCIDRREPVLALFHAWLSAMMADKVIVA
ncbi:hypothetical protein ASE66_01040 [Bosea sp. Root483D1]|nr:hypothetical protein ASE66_01040 [Bosea sp. Root483D1]